jgi:hypothetical protein
MTMQPAGSQGEITGTEQLLFTPGPRLGWVFRARRDLITPYTEPEPDPQAINDAVGTRRVRAQRAWMFAVMWVARPCLPLALVLYVAGVLVRDANHHAHTGGLTVVTVSLAVVGVGWPAWCYVRMMMAADANPQRLHETAWHAWRQRQYAHEQAELERLANVSEWSPAIGSASRTDIYGGTLGGWQALLAVHGASLLAEQPLLIADLSGQIASRELTDLVRRHNVQSATWMLPAQLGASGILAGLTSQQFANALAEAIHAGGPDAATSRADRAVDVRVLEQLTRALSGDVTPVRLAAAVQVALGQQPPEGVLSYAEADTIDGALFQGEYRTHAAPSLVRLDAFLADLARASGEPARQAPRSTWYTCLILEPGAPSASTELLAALVIQWLTARVNTVPSPAIVIAGADDLSRAHLEALTAACERRGVPLTLLFRHLRDDASALIGGAAATGFMRLGNHNEAEQAATFIGRHHKFVVSGWTVTHGGEQSFSRASGHSRGTSQSRGRSSNHGWSEDGLFRTSASGGHTRSRDYGRNEEWSESDTESDGTNWSDATNTERVYEFAVEPTVLQNLPGNALLLPARGTQDVLAVECDPRIITLPGASGVLGGQDEMPPLSPQPNWTDAPADDAPIPRWPGNRA